jgi:hypothetical protein
VGLVPTGAHDPWELGEVCSRMNQVLQRFSWKFRLAKRHGLVSIPLVFRIKRIGIFQGVLRV